MSFMTLDIKDLQERWMKLYLNLMALKSHNPQVTKLLEEMQMHAAEFNSKVMQFFEEMGE